MAQLKGRDAPDRSRVELKEPKALADRDWEDLAKDLAVSRSASYLADEDLEVVRKRLLAKGTVPRQHLKGVVQRDIAGEGGAADEERKPEFGPGRWQVWQWLNTAKETTATNEERYGVEPSG